MNRPVRTLRDRSRSHDRSIRRHLELEVLESRLTPATADFASLFGMEQNDFLAQYQAGAIQWQGNDAFVVQNEWVLSFTQWSGTASQQLAQAKALVAATSPDLSVSRFLGADGLFLLSTAGAMTHSQLVGLLEPIAGLNYVEPNFLLVPTEIPSDTSYASQWALDNTGQAGGVIDADIDAPEAWEITTGSSGVVVAVIDSGVDYTHPDLVANMWVNPGEIAGDGIDNDGNGYIDDVHGWDFANNDSDPMDDNGHGTACAGIIAAAGNNGIGVAGINWGGRIMALKYADANFVAATADVIAAVNYATMMRRDYGVNVRVTSNSYGIFGYSQAVSDAIQAGGDEGILYVSSAGNTNSDNDLGPQYPASYPIDAILSVAATDRNDALASFSSYGATSVDLGAPGVAVLTTRVGGVYSGFSGTSAAAPMVAGVAALLWDAAPYATLAEIRAAILAGTDPLPALQGITVSGGRLNAYGALQQLGLYVHQVTPDVGTVLSSPPLEFVVELSADLDPSSVSADSFLVNGVAADSFEISGGRTIVFRFHSSPVTSEGLQSISLVSGSIVDVTGTQVVSGFTGTFRYDASAMSVVATSPNVGAQSDVALTSLIVSLSEAVDASTLSIRDLALSQGTVVGAQLLNESTIEFLLAGVRREGELLFYLPAYSITDLYGNPFSGYAGSLDLDVSVTSLGAFVPVEPLGSWIAVQSHDGLVNQAGDLDELSFDLAAGETVVAILRPVDASAVLTAEWVGLGGTKVTSLPGNALLVPITKAATGGTFGLRISGDRRSAYTVELYRNTLVEVSDDGSVPLALEPSALAIGDGRLAVVGSSDVDAYGADMAVEPGWKYEGNWAYGKPAGLAGDPNAGFTGPNIVGYNLSGAYPPSLATTQYVTTGPIDMTGQTGVQLSFRRWLGIDNSAFDRANIQVSNNGTTWTTVWQHTGAGIFESGWSLQTYDISAVADNQSTVYVRWGLGRTSAVNNYWGWNIDDVVIGASDAASQDTDTYSIDLTGYAGKRIDIGLVGLGGVDFSRQSLRLLGPNGQEVATAMSMTSEGHNLDLAITELVVPVDGVYTLVLQSRIKGQYSLVVTRSLALDAEPSNAPDGLATNLDNVLAAIGHVGVPPIEGLYNFTIDSSASILSLSGFVTGPGLGFNISLLEQAPGSLSSPLEGSIAAVLNGSSIEFVQARLDALSHPGNFLPFGGPADFAALVSFFGLDGYASVSDIVFKALSDPILLDSLGQFDASQIFFQFEDGMIEYSVLGESGDFPANTPDTSNQVITPGTIEVLPGELRLTLPFRMHFVASVPLGFLVDFDFTAEIVATAALPILDDDVFELTAAAGETITLQTTTPVGSGLNTLDPELVVLGPDGSVIVMDLDSAGDGKNALVSFTAAEAGSYRVLVKATSGMGDYILTVDRSLPPEMSIGGPADGVRGQSRSFTLNVANPPEGDLTFHIDWNGDAIVDQTIIGPAQLAVEHVFAESGNYQVTVTAVSNSGAHVSATHSIVVTNYALQVDPTDSAKVNLVVGGTTGDDLIAVISSGRSLVLWSFGFAGTAVTFTSDSYFANIGGVTGKVIIFGQGGDDLISTQLLIDRSAYLDGGEGNDLLVAGMGDDTLIGSGGDDVLFGGAGADKLWGMAGRDLLFGGDGPDTLSGGMGEDLLVAGATIFEKDASATLAIRSEWTSERSYADRTANLSGNGTGPRSNGNSFLEPAVTVLDDDAVDQVLGEEDRDWLVLDPDEDVSDLEPTELSLSLSDL